MNIEETDISDMLELFSGLQYLNGLLNFLDDAVLDAGLT